MISKHASLANAPTFAAYLAPLRNGKWVVCAKRPLGGPEEVLRCLARYTHHVAISNSHLVSFDNKGALSPGRPCRCIDWPRQASLAHLVKAGVVLGGTR